MRLRFTIIAGLCLVIAGFLLSQPPGASQADPPSRVARLNYMDGSVSYRPDSVQEWTAATVNFPLTNGDHLWTDQQAHAELHVGSKAIRLADQTALSVLNLDDRVAQLSLAQGALSIRVGALEPEETFEVDTPNGAVTLLRSGIYRFDVDPDANFTAVTVLGGDAEVTAGGQAFPVHAGQQGHFSGSDRVAFDVVGAPAPDPWDRWCTNRDQNEQRAVRAASAYVPREMVGAEDLGGYGRWRSDPTYGSVWAPTSVPDGWEPYRYGHWAFVRPWGWTWIDDAPWGFAPFHYGRWAVVDGEWVWLPGRRVGRPVYAPALVAFVGGPRFGIGISLGGGGVAAWIPLGPGEVYRPEYHHSDRYIREVNVTHVTNVTVINQVNVNNVAYVNSTHVVAVPQAAFVGARPVAAAAVVVPASAMARAQVVQANSFAPTRESYAGRPMPAGGAVRVAAPPPAVMSRPVVVRTVVPAPVGASSSKIPTRSANPGGGAFTPGTPRSVNNAPGGDNHAPAGGGTPNPSVRPGGGAAPTSTNAPTGVAPNPNVRPGGGAPPASNNAPAGAAPNPNMRPGGGVNQPSQQQQPQRMPQGQPAQQQPLHQQPAPLPQQQQQPVALPQQQPQRQQEPVPPPQQQRQLQPAPQPQQPAPQPQQPAKQPALQPQQQPQRQQQLAPPQQPQRQQQPLPQAAPPQQKKDEQKKDEQKKDEKKPPQ